ncbi:F0F1 ATP synthase subunit B [Gemmatimonas sp.]
MCSRAGRPTGRPAALSLFVDSSMFASSARRAGVLAAALMFTASPAFASEGGSTDLLSPNPGVMVWTLVIFVMLLFVLSKFAFKPLFAAVEAREQALADAIEGAKRDRAETEAALAQQRAQLEAARNEAQQIIADSRATAEKMRSDLLAQTKQQQEEMIEQARRAIEGEKAAAIADLRKEAVDLAIAGASRVIEQNLDSATNRKIVESFLASLDNPAAR